MKWLCKIIGHNWQRSVLMDMLTAETLSRLAPTIKFNGYACSRCGELGIGS